VRRIFPVPFLTSFGDELRHLQDPLIGEKLQHDSELFNLILEGWKRYRRKLKT
jgi:hypothetical protein